MPLKEKKPTCFEARIPRHNLVHTYLVTLQRLPVLVPRDLGPWRRVNDAHDLGLDVILVRVDESLFLIHDGSI